MGFLFSVGTGRKNEMVKKIAKHDGYSDTVAASSERVVFGGGFIK